MSKYSDKFKDPRWQKKRLEIMERDKFTCLMCAATDKTLNVHHLYYKRNADPWDYENHELITLCEDCHSEKMPELMSVFNMFLFKMLSWHGSGGTTRILKAFSRDESLCWFETISDLVNTESGMSLIRSIDAVNCEAWTKGWESYSKAKKAGNTDE